MSEAAIAAVVAQLKRPYLTKVRVLIIPKSKSLQPNHLLLTLDAFQEMQPSHVGGGFWLGGLEEFHKSLPDEKKQMAFEYRGQHWPVVSDQEFLS
jgi:hypothetical protein